MSTLTFAKRMTCYSCHNRLQLPHSRVLGFTLLSNPFHLFHQICVCFAVVASVADCGGLPLHLSLRRRTRGGVRGDSTEHVGGRGLEGAATTGRAVASRRISPHRQPSACQSGNASCNSSSVSASPPLPQLYCNLQEKQAIT
jgi:hypothetical protein